MLIVFNQFHTFVSFLFLFFLLLLPSHICLEDFIFYDVGILKIQDTSGMLHMAHEHTRFTLRWQISTFVWSFINSPGSGAVAWSVTPRPFYWPTPCAAERSSTLWLLIGRVNTRPGLLHTFTEGGEDILLVSTASTGLTYLFVISVEIITGRNLLFKSTAEFLKSYFFGVSAVICTCLN